MLTAGAPDSATPASPRNHSTDDQSGAAASAMVSSDELTSATTMAGLRP